MRHAKRTLSLALRPWRLQGVLNVNLHRNLFAAYYCQAAVNQLRTGMKLGLGAIASGGYSFLIDTIATDAYPTIITRAAACALTAAMGGQYVGAVHNLALSEAAGQNNEPPAYPPGTSGPTPPSQE